MNTVAILPQLVMKLLQTQNVKRNNVVGKKSIVEEQQPTIAAIAAIAAIETIAAKEVPNEIVPNDMSIGMSTDNSSGNSSNSIGTTLIDDLQQTTAL